MSHHGIEMGRGCPIQTEAGWMLRGVVALVGISISGWHGVGVDVKGEGMPCATRMLWRDRVMVTATMKCESDDEEGRGGRESAGEWCRAVEWPVSGQSAMELLSKVAS